MNLIIFILVLSVLVIVHEWGHYITAKKLGIRVEKFSVGFGKRLFSKTIDGTEFMVCAVPLGGYVKLHGDERSKCKGTPDEFYSHPVRHRALVVLMGPVINIVFAYLCLYFIFVSGFPLLDAEIGKVMEDYPAAEAGLLEGDKILSVNGKIIEGWEDVQEQILGTQAAEVSLTIEREGQNLQKVIVPREEHLTNIFGQEQKVRVIGIQPGESISFVRYGPIESFGRAGFQMVRITTLTFQALYHVVTGGMPAKDALAGPIRIFDVIAQAADMGFTYLLYITGIISLNLAIFNLFPIPVLDGGHLFLMVIEKFRGRPLAITVEDRLARVGLSLLMCLMAFVLYNDMREVGWFDAVKNFFQNLSS